MHRRTLKAVVRPKKAQVSRTAPTKANLKKYQKKLKKWIDFYVFELGRSDEYEPTLFGEAMHELTRQLQKCHCELLRLEADRVYKWRMTRKKNSQNS